MAGEFETRTEKRARLDAQAMKDAYHDLMYNVGATGFPIAAKSVDPTLSDAAVRACLSHLGVEAGAVPSSVRDASERIDWLCRPSGTMYRNVHLDDQWYRRSYGVLLSQLDEGELVALIPRKLGGYFYQEPGTGRLIRVDQSNAERLSSEALAFYRPLPNRPCAWRDLVSFVLTSFDWADYAMAIGAVLAITLVGLLPAWASQQAFEIVAPSNNPQLILPIATLMVGVAISRGLFNVSRNVIMGRVASKLDATTEAASFARLLTLPAGFFKHYSSGELANRLSSMRGITQAISSVLLGSVLTAIFSLVYVFQIGSFAPQLMVPALVIITVQTILSVSITLSNMRYERASREARAKLSGLESSLLGGIQKIKLAGAEQRALAKWGHYYARYAHTTYNRPIALRILPALVTATSLIGTVIMYQVAGHSHVSVPNYMAFNMAYGQATVAIMALVTAAEQIAQIRPMYEMVKPILSATPEVSSGRSGVGELDGAVSVGHVSFRYEENAPYVLEDLSFDIRPGEYVAIVGRSGCGKSTLVRLLLGFEQPEHGSIRYGRYDVSKVDVRSLRQRIGLVLQNGRLFTGDIASNILIATPKATLDDAWEAAELACIADDIRKMPMGMRTMVSEGSGSVSGGQRQRILIARAVCGHRKVLILDEATSALDNVTQSSVSEALDALDCTRIVIAHRLSTIRHCDRILVLDGGRIVEQGTYDELIKQDGLFADLVARQRLDA